MPSHGGQRKVSSQIIAPYVSIHALARRATQGARPHRCPVGGFNSCPRTEGNPAVDDNRKEIVKFQFMPSHGGQHGLVSYKWCVITFQFMPSHGGQHVIWSKKLPFPMFQFMPSHGGQPHSRSLRQRTNSFNSCPRTEGNLFLAYRPRSQP